MRHGSSSRRLPSWIPPELPRLMRWLHPERKRLLPGTLAVLTVSTSSLAIPVALKWIFDVLLTQGSSGQLAARAVLLGGLFLINGVVGYYQGVLFHLAAARMVARVRQRLVDRWLRWPLQRHHQHELGGLITIATQDGEALYRLVAHGLAPLVQNGLMVTGGILLMAWLYWPAALGLLILLTGPALWIRRRSPTITSLFASSQAALEEAWGLLESALQTLPDVKGYGAGHWVARHCAQHLDAAADARATAQKHQSANSQLLYLVFSLLTLFIFVGGGHIQLQGGLQLSIILTLFVYGYTTALAAIALYRALGLFREARPAIARIAQMHAAIPGMTDDPALHPPVATSIPRPGPQDTPNPALPTAEPPPGHPARQTPGSPALESPPAEKSANPIPPATAAQSAPADSANPIPPANTARSAPADSANQRGVPPPRQPPTPAPQPRDDGLSIRGLTFSYPGQSTLVLNQLDLEVAPGEWILITGPSGCGKSTLLALLGRLYEPTRGAILLGGVPLQDMLLHEARARVALAPQAPGVFPGTLISNIRFGREDLSYTALTEALQVAQLSALPTDDAHPLPLSSGERARLGVARSLAGDPLILALDEATGPLDPATETALWGALHQCRKGRTTLIITHRPERVPHCHRRLILQEGRLLEAST